MEMFFQILRIYFKKLYKIVLVKKEEDFYA